MAKLISDTIFERRDEIMISPDGESNPTLRTAHFLKPTINLVEDLKKVDAFFPSSQQPNSSSSTSSSYNIKEMHKKVNFHPSQYRDNDASWKSWFERLRPKHESAWRKAGIFEAILSSTYKISKQDEVIFGAVEKWCPETNTFAFPWGEATISLEDMIVLGGFSVLGENLSYRTDDMKESEETLMKACSDIKRLTGNVSRLKTWLSYIDKKKDARKIEHEAFLYCWLVRYVFTHPSLLLGKHLFPLAIHLAGGTRIALAPAVLACIYKNLSALKARMIHDDAAGDEMVPITLCAPLHLVLVWVWERFPTFSPNPNPNPIQCGNEPRLARWNNVKKNKVENVRLSIDSEGENFRWRPYAASSTLKIWPSLEFQGYKALWNSSNLDVDLESLVRCLRVSKLVGFDCTEQYPPHRVALQFGFDQDIPADCVLRSNSETIEKAWSKYIRPIGDVKLYIPSRLFESDVTMRYFAWWRGLTWAPHDAVLGVGEEHGDLIEPKPVAKQHNELNLNPEVQSLVCEGICENVNVEVLSMDVVEKKRADNPTTKFVVERQNEVERSLMSNVIETKEANQEADIFGAVTGSQDSEEDCIDSTVETPGLELELRIEKLEEIFAKLKRSSKAFGKHHIVEM